MAIDTQDKRASIVGLGFLRIYPLADGSLALEDDREQIAFLYRGLLATAPAISSISDNAGLFGTPPSYDALPDDCICGPAPAYDALPTTCIY